MSALQPAINMGLDEERFWNMTIAEIQRFVNGATWRMKSQAQFDYMLGHLIGLSVARVMSKDAKYPPIEEVYPDLFAEEIKRKEEITREQQEEIKTQKSVNNFLAFAMANNAKRKKEVSN